MAVQDSFSHDAACSAAQRRIDPSRRRPDGSPDDNDRVETGPTALAFAEWAALGLTVPDLERLRAYRLGRLRAQLAAGDCAGLLLFDPLNIRYATDSSNMQVWITHNACRACFISTEGPVVLWDFHGCDHLSAHLPLIDDIRHGAAMFYFECGDRMAELAGRFADEIDDLVRGYGGGNRRLAVDKIELSGVRALDARGLVLIDGQAVTEHARAIKSTDELNAMRCALAACEAAIGDMHTRLIPGLSEAELWAALHHGNIVRGGEWIETRLLSSGQRTNPWYQECGPRIIQPGEVVAFDTDLIGPYGYCADISRTWVCGAEKPDGEIKRLYQLAYEHVQSNLGLLKPGVAFRELTETAHRLPEAYRPQRYGVIVHGVGMCDEYPSIRYPEDYAACGYEGVLQAGMTVCVEAYVGAVGGPYGVKLEEQVLITDSGAETLSRYPFDPTLMG